jgi:hypothetical protein
MTEFDSRLDERFVCTSLVQTGCEAHRGTVLRMLRLFPQWQSVRAPLSDVFLRPRGTVLGKGETVNC